MKSLPLKYRPQQIENLIGQEFITTTLKNALTTNRIAPAYLFAGARGTGKTSTARILAKSLNCLSVEQPTVEPCGECSSCKSIERSNSIDVTEIDAASHNGVDHARELVELSHLAPSQVRYKMFLIDECHCLTSAAQNALLKLIEEPPARTVFILCTTELHKVLPTIVSRCQLFNFKSLSQAAVVEHLNRIATTEKIDITAEAIDAIAKSSLGSLRDSLQLLSQLQVLQQQITLDVVVEAVGGISPQELWKLMVNLVKEDVLKVLVVAKNLIQTGKSPELILKDLLNAHRDLLLIGATSQDCKSLLSSNLEYDKLRQLANKMDRHGIERNLEQLQKREQQLRFSINNAVWLETCLLNMMNATRTQETKVSHAERGQKAEGRRQKERSRRDLDPPATENRQIERTSHVRASFKPTSAKGLARMEGKGRSKPSAICPKTSAFQGESLGNRQSPAKTAKSTVSLGELWTNIVKSTKSSNQKMLSHANLVGFDRELNFAVLAVEPKYVAKFQNHTTCLSRIISQSLKQQQPIKVIIEEKQ